jgi:hypothetical protein
MCARDDGDRHDVVADVKIGVDTIERLGAAEFRYPDSFHGCSPYQRYAHMMSYPWLTDQLILLTRVDWQVRR